MVGVLALQGDFAEHLEVLTACGYPASAVRSNLDVDALIVPGGESTTILKLLDRYGLRDPLVKRIEDGMPVFGTCAGAIVLASHVSDGEKPLGVVDISIERNGYGRQRDSFEVDIEVPTLAAKVSAVFIRAPVITDPGDATVMAEWAGRPVLVRSGNILLATFHPELAGEQRLHRYFVEEICGGAG